jgi:hypothetical protein
MFSISVFLVKYHLTVCFLSQISLNGFLIFSLYLDLEATPN